MNKNLSFDTTLKHVNEFGLTVIHVIADEKGPGFSYSIGLYKNYNHPEIIMIGLKRETMHVIINNIAEDIKKGKIYIPFLAYDDILNDYECFFIEVKKDNYIDYVGQAINFYKSDDFPLLQCVYPDKSGVYPWQDEWHKSLKNVEPLLGENKSKLKTKN